MTEDRLAQFIEMAIKREEEAFFFYTDLLDKVSDESSRETLRWIAKEEQKHRAYLMNYRDQGLGRQALRMTDVTYYKIAENQEEPEIKENMDSKDVFLVAAHRERRSHAFYTEIAGLHPEGGIRDMLLRMANEELKHKEKMEYLYTNATYTQTSGG